MKSKFFNTVAFFTLIIVMIACKNEQKQEPTNSKPTDTTSVVPVADESQRKAREEARQTMKDSLEVKQDQ